jgi:hypothetical protein
LSENLDQWRADFRENAGIAAEAPAPEADTATDEPAQDGRARDEQGRFTTAEQADTEQPTGDEPAPEPTADTVDGDDTDDELARYLAKYGGDTDKALRAAVEAQKLIGRQGSEVGALRAELAQRFDALEQQQAAQAQPAYTADDVQQFLDENPGMAPQLAQRAKEIGDDQLYARAMGAWAEIDQAGAMDYAGKIAAWEATNQIRQEFAPMLTAAQQQANSAAVNNAVEQTATKHPDFAEVINTITPEVWDSIHPAIREDLRTGDAQAKASALETLYYAARGVQSERQPQAQAAAQQATQQTARDARTQAAVGSATTNSPAPRESSSNVEAWREDFRNSPEFRKAAGLT